MACLNKRRRRRALFDMPLCAPRERPLQRRRSFPKNVFPFLPSLFLPTFSLIFFFVFFVVVLIHGFDSLPPPRVCYYVAATAVVSACNQAVPSPRLHSHTHTPCFPHFPHRSRFRPRRSVLLRFGRRDASSQLMDSLTSLAPPPPFPYSPPLPRVAAVAILPSIPRSSLS